MDLQALELSFLLHLQELHTPVLDGIMTVITHLGDGGVLFIAMGVLLAGLALWMFCLVVRSRKELADARVIREELYGEKEKG